MVESALGRRIAVGRTAEVYGFGVGRVLKLFREGRRREVAEREVAAGALAYRMGTGAPRVDALVQVGQRVGIVYERVEGPTLLDQLSRRPWTVVAAGRQLADLHVLMHRRPASGSPPLPIQREVLRREIEAAQPLAQETRQLALAALEQVRDDANADRLCHGDFHPDNVVLTKHGARLLDWLTACRGSPIADVARTRLLLLGGALPPGSSVGRQVLALVGRQALCAVYLRRYAAGAGVRWDTFRTRLEAWRLPIAAARLAEGIRDEEAALMREVARLAAE